MLFFKYKQLKRTRVIGQIQNTDKTEEIYWSGVPNPPDVKLD